METRFSIGVVFPQYEIGSDPSVVRDYAVAAEALGFSHLLAYDHVLGAEQRNRTPPLTGPYDETHHFHEPLTLYAFLAGVTRSIEFVTGVLVLPQRQTALVAKQAAEVSLMSQGRLRLGVGVGWNHIEYQALGEDPTTRGRRMDEQILMLRRLWSEDVVSYSGRFHRIDRAALQPRPHEPIQIWMGGSSRPAHERAARLGDGFLFSRRRGRRGDALSEPLDGVIEDGLRLRERATTNRPNAQGFGLEARVNLSDGVEICQEEIELLEASGFDGVTVDMMELGLRGAEHISELAVVAKALGLVPPA